MAIQWSLVIFTALTGIAGWLLASTAVAELKGICKKTTFAAGATAFVLLVVGGCASVTHLSHPERMLEALNHPTSGIFVEAVLVGVTAVLTALYLILVKREGAAGARKALAVAAAAVGVVLSFSAGSSYMMASIPAWDTALLPLAYLGTAIPGGVATFLAIAAMREEGADELALPSKLLLAGGIVAAVLAAGYSACAASAGAAAIACGWGLAVIVGGIVPAGAGLVLGKKPQQALPLAVTALACAVIGAVALRCLMWMVGTGTINFFSAL